MSYLTNRKDVCCEDRIPLSHHDGAVAPASGNAEGVLVVEMMQDYATVCYENLCAD
jgi:hypothetical protein